MCFYVYKDILNNTKKFCEKRVLLNLTILPRSSQSVLRKNSLIDYRSFFFRVSIRCSYFPTHAYHIYKIMFLKFGTSALIFQRGKWISRWSNYILYAQSFIIHSQISD